MRITLLSFSFFFLFLSAFTGYGQGRCSIGGGGFTINTTAGCAPLYVEFKSTVPNATFVGYDLNYTGGEPNLSTNRTSITYQSAAKGTLLQYGVTNTGAEFSHCEKITIYESRRVNMQYASCGGGKIVMTLTDDDVLKAYDQVEINWGDGEPPVYWKKGDALTFEHNYASVTSSPTLSITGLYDGGKPCAKGLTAPTTIKFERAQLNEIQVSAVEMRIDGTIRLTYKGVAGIPTNIQYSTDGSTYVTSGKRSSGGTQPYDIKGTNPAQSYKVRLSSEDLCAGSTETQPISTMTMTGTSTDGTNTLKWNQYPDASAFDGYDLLRDGVVIKSFSGITETTYADSDVECGSFAEYQIVAKLKTATSMSAPVPLKVETGSAKPLSGGSVSVLDKSSVAIKASVPGAGPNTSFELTIERAEAGSTLFKKIITLYNQNDYIDNAAKTDELSYCYRMSYENSCDQKVPASEPICTILLTKKLTTLNWTGDNPILGGFEDYTVVQTGSGGASEDIPVQKNTSYTVKLNNQSALEYNFLVRAVSQDGSFESLSNIVNYRRSAGVFVPDAFTPNGDGYNDILEAKSEQLQSFNMSVMNRWGVVVFHSDDIAKGWDGTFEGTNAPVGYYYYKMTFVDDINQTVEKSGTFMLLR
ncbi:gliding motility-associated-like protein [Dyadobacter sp. BE34]|uniref:Gliding motility-associated-like protein n=1 Tax=Dyadobacter fermentans TaxID=94254 RepID=A0ABU1R945_9BACT|nr:MULTISPECIES: gliding motility-associated C-terminal domain-containing protein [Dyadobacter]MDR6809450.1 gliding motility-associated-like protein [Dyadobacter fermentans]MDR7047400.1 gliding motility-associated-like protein [Dyadobacter sp. BE242]MDR7195077.1 gliding motility-associated-like protein [Dyadobacter sp. BE34]MDR7214378.1 gliding motility-associated-like protein [Dyadobacter sp. BE31]MDR7266999.1 gliding motility-associated-like protein [Dyadobacter sp. BE32]